MLIDVQDAGLNYLLNGCLSGIAVVTLLSLMPLQLSEGLNRWILVLPWIGLTLYFAYEYAIPARMDIRLDLILILPLMAVTLLVWLVRLWRIKWLGRSGQGQGPAG